MKALTEKQTIQFGKKIAKNLRPGDILCLCGNLGTGKTTLVKGIAQGLRIKKNITSPTFTLMNIYDTRNTEYRICHLAHIDTYRLKSERELIEIGVEDYLGAPDTVCVIEWPEKIRGLLKGKHAKSIKIKTINENSREIEMNF